MALPTAATGVHHTLSLSCSPGKALPRRAGGWPQSFSTLWGRHSYPHFIDKATRVTQELVAELGPTPGSQVAELEFLSPGSTTTLQVVSVGGRSRQAGNPWPHGRQPSTCPVILWVSSSKPLLPSGRTAPYFLQCSPHFPSPGVLTGSFLEKLL